MSPVEKPCAVLDTTASVALEMPLTVFAAAKAVATEKIVPVGTEAIIISFK